MLETIDPATGKNNADRYYRTNEIDAYVQDKWQMMPNLSITLGVRYDYHGGMTEKYGDMFNFDPKFTASPALQRFPISPGLSTTLVSLLPAITNRTPLPGSAIRP